MTRPTPPTTPTPSNAKSRNSGVTASGAILSTTLSVRSSGPFASGTSDAITIQQQALDLQSQLENGSYDHIRYVGKTGTSPAKGACYIAVLINYC